MAIDFASRFKELVGHEPFPWQQRLYGDWFAGGEIPNVCRVPTGLGKTSVIAVWWIAREAHARLPRRLVYVVNRRTVIDQTTAEAEKLQAKVGKNNLAISTLRGQHAETSDWFVDPGRPAIVCGTVDLIGSRLLFSGYRVGDRAKPLHAAFLGVDSLLVHDEAHLEQPFQELIESIQQEQRREQALLIGPLKGMRVMALSATPRSGNGMRGLESGSVLAIDKTDADYAHPVASRRLNASKKLTLHYLREDKKLAEEIAKQALRWKESGDAVLIYVRKLDDVEKVQKSLTRTNVGVAADRVLLLAGTMRGKERDKMVDSPLFKRFSGRDLSDGQESVEETVYLVSTSAGEVGVDLSADHLVCDLAPLDSMAQRFGRLNRLGLREDSEVDVFCPAIVDDKDPYAVAAEATRPLLELLPERDGAYDASPAELSNLMRELESRGDAVLEESHTPLPTRLPLTDVLLDAWSLTSIPGELPGRPAVEPYLHGVAEWDPPITQVGWRDEVGLITGDRLQRHPPKTLLAAYPLRPHELLSDRTARVLDTLRRMFDESKKKQSNRPELVKLLDDRRDANVWIVDGRLEVDCVRLAKLVAMDKKQLEQQLQHKTLLLSPVVGGLREGLLNADALPPDKGSLDVADWVPIGVETQRHRAVGDESSNGLKSQGMVRILSIELENEEAADGAKPRFWHWCKLRPTEDSRTANKPVLLATHTGDVADRLNQFLQELKLPDELNEALRAAAKLHDVGKDREAFQVGVLRNFGYPKAVWAKSDQRGARRPGPAYRHEFGSLADAEADPQFQSLTLDLQDLVRHLIAAHHGRARPHFSAEEAYDPRLPDDASANFAREVPRRFARLQRRYGRWGLAYLESLLRAADWAASAEPSSYVEGGCL